jgi:hypothetical protein
MHAAKAASAAGKWLRAVASRSTAYCHCLEYPRDLFRTGDTLASRIRQSRDSGADFTAAVKSCGVGSAHAPSFVEVLLPPKTLIRYLDRWTACIAKNGYELAPPNTSGEGPVFPVGTDRISGYRAAATHCVSIERQELNAMRLAGQS